MSGIAYQTIGYQTLEDRENADEVEQKGPFKCTRTDAWLHEGYYFWDDDIERANSWGKECYDEYIILKCDLYFDKLLDLVGNRKCQREFNELYKTLEQYGKLKKLNETPVPKIIKAFRDYNKIRKGIFDYEGVRMQDHPDKRFKVFYNNKRHESCDLNPRIQICLFEKISNKLPKKNKIIYPQKYI